MGSMSASDAAPLPRLGEVFFDVRGSSRSMRLSWYSDTGVAVFSIWQGGTCTGTFRLPIDDLPRMVEALQRGPRGAALPAADGRDAAGRPAAPRHHRRPADRDALGGQFLRLRDGPDIAPVTGEFGHSAPATRPRACRATATPTAGTPASACRDDSVAGPRPATASRPTRDPLGSGSYPATGTRNPGASFPGYADDGPPPPSGYRARRRPTATTRWAAATATTRPARRSRRTTRRWARAVTTTTRPARSTRWTGPSPLGPGSGYREESLPGHRDSGPSYAGDPLGSGPTRATGIRRARAARSPGTPMTGRPRRRLPRPRPAALPRRPARRRLPGPAVRLAAPAGRSEPARARAAATARNRCPATATAARPTAAIRWDPGLPGLPRTGPVPAVPG